MSIRNLKDGSQKSWLCECYPQGRAGKRVRKCFTTKGDATAYELHLMKEVDDNPCMGSKPDSRRLSDIVDLWYSHYGCTLVNGDVIIQKFHHMVKAMGNLLHLRSLPKCIPISAVKGCLGSWCLLVNRAGIVASRVYRHSTLSKLVLRRCLRFAVSLLYFAVSVLVNAS